MQTTKTGNIEIEIEKKTIQGKILHETYMLSIPRLWGQLSWFYYSEPFLEWVTC